jgi:hypothetical protein
VSRLVFLTAIVFGACAPTPDAYTIHRFSVDASNEFPPLDRTVDNPVAAARLYTKALALPRDPLPGGRFCNLDLGLRYELTFFSGGTRLLHGILTRGCGGLDLGVGDHRVIDESFWAELAGDLGFYTRGNDLFPTPLPRQ